MERLGKLKISDRTGLLLVPPVMIFFVFLIIPLLLLFVIGFNPSVRGAIAFQAVFSLENFQRFFSEALFLNALFNSLKLGILTVVACLILGYPLAYIMARSRSALRIWLLIMLILPLMTSVVIRSFGWMVLLNRSGPIVGLLRDLGLVGRNFNLMQSETAIVIAMVQVLLPFMTLSILGVIMRLDIRIEEAARTMGCSYLGAIYHVVLPLCLPGLVAGSLLTFTLSASSFVTPSLLGGARLQVLASSIYNSVTQTLDWSFASAQAVVLFIGIALLLLAYLSLSRQRLASQGV